MSRSILALALAAGAGGGAVLRGQEAPAPARSESFAPAVALRTPQLSSILPMGARPGSSVTVELSGEFLDRAERVVFDRPDIFAVVRKSSFSRIQLAVELNRDAEPGPRYFRVITPRGASNLLLFRVSEWPSLLEKEPNQERRDLPRVEWPVLISGQLATARDVDLFRFYAPAGQPLSLSLLAARNWSGADLSLAILDAAGRAVRQDEGRFIWDPHISFTAPRDGDYFAAVMLTRMPAGGQSRTDLVYQLAIGPAPLLYSAFPLAARSGEPVRLQVRGEFLDRAAAWFLDGAKLEPAGDRERVLRVAGPVSGAALELAGNDAPARSARSGLPVAPRHASGLIAPLSLLVTELPTLVEAANNDDLASAQPILLPVIVNGRIETDWDEDIYRFEAESCDELVFIVDSEKWGTRLDARLTLLNAAGKTLASNDDARVMGRPLNRDPRLEFTVPGRGVYYVKVHSLQRRGGEDFVYALTARKQAPGFTLGLGSERVAVRRGDKANWTINVQREEGFSGDVEIRAAGLPPSVRAEPLVIRSDKNSGSLMLVAAADAAPAAVPVRISGRAVVREKELVVQAHVPAARIIGSGPGFINYVASDGWVSVVEPPLFSLESAVSEVFLVRGGSAEFGVKVARRPDAKGDPQFALENLPEGVSIENVEMIDQGRMARLTLRAAETAAVGRAPSVTIIGTLPNTGPNVGPDVAGGPAMAARRSEAAPRINVQVD